MPSPLLSDHREQEQLRRKVEAMRGEFRCHLQNLIELFGSQTALSEAIDVGLSTLRKYFYLDPPANPSLGNVLRIEIVAGVDHGWLCRGENADTCELPVLDAPRAVSRELRFTGQRYPLRASLIADDMRRNEELYVAICRNLETAREKSVKRPAVVRRLPRPREDLPRGLYLMHSPDGAVLRRLPAADGSRGAADVLGRCVWTWTGAED